MYFVRYAKDVLTLSAQYFGSWKHRPFTSFNRRVG
jgi:hypothetical protein